MYNLIQWNNNSINKNLSDTDRAYEKLIFSHIGYQKPDEFWELPQWAAQVAHVLVRNDEACKFTVLDDTVKLTAHDTVIGSVLDVNLDLWLNLISVNDDVRFLLGGYVNSDSFGNFNNVLFFDNVKEMSDFIGIDYSYGHEWNMFQGYKCIPRLTMSYGCRHKCRFCTIPDLITEVESEDIIAQAKAFIPLDFKLVYIDDKTFGQADNHIILKKLYRLIRSYNSEFLGFIVQTTVNQSLNINFANLHVKVVEIGVESFNDYILKSVNKPANERLIKKSVEKMSKENVSIIPNIIIGMIGENDYSYDNTFKFLSNNRFNHANIYNLAVYKDSELSQELNFNTDDMNELNTEKSFYSSKQNQLNTKMYDKFRLLFLQN